MRFGCGMRVPVMTMSCALLTVAPCALVDGTVVCPSGGMWGPKNNDPILQARSRENHIPIVFVHPAEFLVTGPDGSILERVLLRDKGPIARDEQGGDNDHKRVAVFDVPVKRKAAP